MRIEDQLEQPEIQSLLKQLSVAEQVSVVTVLKKLQDGFGDCTELGEPEQPILHDLLNALQPELELNALVLIVIHACFKPPILDKDIFNTYKGFEHYLYKELHKQRYVGQQDAEQEFKKSLQSALLNPKTNINFNQQWKNF